MRATTTTRTLLAIAMSILKGDRVQMALNSAVYDACLLVQEGASIINIMQLKGKHFKHVL